MGAGVFDTGGSYAADAAPERSGAGRWRELRRPLAFASLLAASLFAVMAATGIGTGPGPLGDCCGYGAGIRREVGDTVTEGNAVLGNPGWFPVVLESIRPLPAPGAAEGLEVTAVEMARLPPPEGLSAVGMVDGAGWQYFPAERRQPVDEFVLPPRWRAGEHHGLGEVLVRYRITQEGTWTYRGYEVTYRSGLVRHRAVLDVTMTACAPASRYPDCGSDE